MDIAKALFLLNISNKWTLNGSEYSGLVWKDDDVIKPTKDELQSVFDKNNYITLRADAYSAAGLTFDYWSEINIERDQEKIDKYISDREKIRLQFPAPNQ